MYGAPLTVPGDFSHSICSDSKFHLQRLCEQVCLLAPIPTCQRGAVLALVPCDLQQAKFVFIRLNAHRTPFQLPYEGPYKLLQPGLKTFKIDRGGISEQPQSTDVSLHTWIWNTLPCPAYSGTITWTASRESPTCTYRYHPTPQPRRPQ